MWLYTQITDPHNTVRVNLPTTARQQLAQALLRLAQWVDGRRWWLAVDIAPNSDAAWREASAKAVFRGLVAMAKAPVAVAKAVVAKPAPAYVDTEPL